MAPSSSSHSWRSSSSSSWRRPPSSCRSRARTSSSAWASSRSTLGAGFHVLLPFIDVIRYQHTLKEQSSDIPEQVCITRDNVQVGVDGILYLKVLNPERASYGISDYTSPSRSSPRRRCAARSARSTSTAPSRSARNINTAGRDGAGQGVRALGRQGPALRDQEHHPARRTSWPPWRSRCAPSGRSAR